MTITQQQVVDLREGDVVELHLPAPSDFVMRGTVVRHDNGELSIGDKCLKWGDGRPASWTEDYTLTVVSRAPRPLYVNHPRTEPVAGDVLRSADDADDERTWTNDGLSANAWCELRSFAVLDRADLPDSLRLLVDGETGQVVP